LDDWDRDCKANFKTHDVTIHTYCGAYFATFYPMDSSGKAGEALKTFCREFGVPDKLRFDGSKEQTGKKTELQQQIRKHNIKQHVSEPDMHNQGPAECVVGEIRK
jgi:hypothetical protein